MNHHCLWCSLGNLCTFHKKLIQIKYTWISVAVSAVSLWINSDHIGNVGTFNIHFVEHLLTNVVKFIGEDPSINSNSVIGLFANNSVGNFCEPPYS